MHHSSLILALRGQKQKNSAQYFALGLLKSYGVIYVSYIVSYMVS